MYFKKFKFFHGIMFHHFHDNKKHSYGQGSIDINDLINIIKFIGRNNILNAEEFFYRLHENKLKETDVCFTFDDAIKSQFDIALPVLEDFKIKSFFFIYSNLFTSSPDLLEIYRYFRNNFFTTIDNFYNEFFSNIKSDTKHFLNQNSDLINVNKIKFPHYSINDIKFRLIRDKYLTQNDYKIIMEKMFQIKNFEPKDYYNLLFMSKKDLKDIFKLGHKIGLHSHSHPTIFEKLNYEKQLFEYKKNKNTLSNILNVDENLFNSMSHPCGSYNEDTKKILKNLGIKIGFKQIMTLEKERNMKKINNSYLEIARHDHSDIISMMNK